ncbi:MAG: hypothetical protein KC519_12870 [Anaerolineae bacterium]|nr:hypothetical protein [Anaerolineae bacterium]
MTLDEAAEVAETFQKMCDELGLNQYVTVSDFSDCKRIPSDVTNLRKLVTQDKRMISSVIIKAPLFAQIMGRMLSRITPMDIINADSLEEGQTIAQRILANEHIQTNLK